MFKLPASLMVDQFGMNPNVVLVGDTDEHKLLALGVLYECSEKALSGSEKDWHFARQQLVYLLRRGAIILPENPVDDVWSGMAQEDGCVFMFINLLPLPMVLAFGITDLWYTGGQESVRLSMRAAKLWNAGKTDHAVSLLQRLLAEGQITPICTLHVLFVAVFLIHKRHTNTFQVHWSPQVRYCRLS